MTMICKCCGHVSGETAEEIAEEIIREACIRFGVFRTRISESGPQGKAVKRARWNIWYRLVIERGWSAMNAAYATSGRMTNHDRGSVYYAIRRYAHEELGTPISASIDSIRAAYKPALEVAA